jgi:hypothetical protein
LFDWYVKFFIFCYLILIRIQTANKDEIRIPAEPGVRDEIVELVLKFLEYRANHPDSKDEMDKIALDKESSLNMHEWDKDFFASMKKETYLRVLLAANFLNIPILTTIAQKHLANVIKSIKPEDLKAFFTIPDDVSDDQRKP